MDLAANNGLRPGTDNVCSSGSCRLFRVPFVPEMEHQSVPLGMECFGTLEANGTLSAISGNYRPILI